MIILPLRIGNEPTKIGRFQTSESIFEVKFQLNLPENDFLIRELSLRTLLILVISEKLYLVNLCPIFVGSFPILSGSWQIK